MIGSYDELVGAIRERIDGLNISRHQLDHLAGLPSGYSGKVLGRRRAKRFGSTSLGPLLGAIGCKLVLIEDSEQTARVRGRAKQRDAKQVRYPIED